MPSSPRKVGLIADIHPVRWYARLFGGEDKQEMAAWACRLKRAVRDGKLRAYRFDDSPNATIHLAKRDVERFVDMAGERQVALSPAEARAIDDEVV